MKLVVVGGHSRDIGKTSVTAGIISASKDLGWAAFKITQYGHDICSAKGEECECTVEDPDCPYSIAREQDRSGASDTSRFLRAGAREAYWVRTRAGGLAEAVPALRRLLEERQFVILESNSILEFLRPDVYLPVLNFAVSDFKASSKKYFNRADAYIVVGTEADQPAWSGVESQALEDRPVFFVEPPGYSSPAIRDFILSKLGFVSG